MLYTKFDVNSIGTGPRWLGRCESPCMFGICLTDPGLSVIPVVAFISSVNKRRYNWPKENNWIFYDDLWMALNRAECCYEFLIDNRLGGDIGLRNVIYICVVGLPCRSLADNLIVEVTEFALDQLYKLENLVLKRNRISIIHERAFESLASLRFLWVTRGEIHLYNLGNIPVNL